MLLEYRCGCGESFERIVARGNLAPQRCSCGEMATRQFSPFNQRQFKVDRSNWALVAPTGADGKPMTMKEASKVVDISTPGEADREQRRQRAALKEKQALWKKEAADAAWRELSARNRITVRSV